MRRLALAAALVLLCPGAVAETITYEIYEISKIGSRLIAKGQRHYTVADVKVHPFERDGRKVAEEFVELEKRDCVGARIFSKRSLRGSVC
jgi:hypothetical protein